MELDNDVGALEKISEKRYKDDEGVRKQELWTVENGDMRWNITTPE